MAQLSNLRKIVLFVASVALLLPNLSIATSLPAPFQQAESSPPAYGTNPLQATLENPEIAKRLVPTSEPGIWTVESSTDERREWTELANLEIADSFDIALPGPVAEQFAGVRTTLLVGTVRTSAGVHRYVAGAAIDSAASLFRSDGRAFLPLFVHSDLDQVVDFASSYLTILDRNSDEEASHPGPRTGDCLGNCEEDLDAQTRWCAIDAGYCNTQAFVLFTGCVIVCAGAPPCEGVCLTSYLLAIGRCSINLMRCNRSALRDHTRCVAQCVPGGG